MVRTRLAALVAAFCFTAVPALADELTVTGGVTLTLTPWSQAVSVPRFDPALGTLQSVRVELRNTIRGRVGYENLAAAPASSTIAFQGTLNLAGPAGFAMATIATVPVAVQTQAFDGANDQAGSSGGLLTNLFAQASTQGLPNPNQTNAFVGAGTIALQLSASNTTALQSGSPLAISSRVTLDALISVTYTYAPLAPASPGGYTRPGSLLLFPEFDSNPATTSVITVTTHHTGTSPVRVRFVYIDGATCFEFNRSVELLPGDTHTSLSSAHHVQAVRGYLYVYATNAGGQAIAHDMLSGSMIGLNGLTNYDYGMNALAFRAGSGLTLTDVDGDGLRDLNGVEYERAPDELLFTRFIGTTASRNADLILVNLTGGGAFTAVVNLLLRNDNTELFSAQHAFSCWTKTALSTISGAFSNSFLQVTSHNPNEIVGSTSNESGWFSLDGQSSASANVLLSDPAILGVLVERTGTTGFAAEMPFFTGEQSNGDLVITSPDGDTTGG
jgi:hypothetical protein